MSFLLWASNIPLCIYATSSLSIHLSTYGQGERGGVGEMYGKSNIKTYITICKIDSQQELAVWLRKLKQGLCIKLEDVVGDGREVQKGGVICIPMADSCGGLIENKKIL